MKIYLNDGWEFTQNYSEEFMHGGAADASVRLPHTVAETPLNCFDESIYQMVSGYRKTLNYDPAWVGKRLILTFEGAAHKAEVYLNGRRLAVHENGYTAFSVEITEAVTQGENLLCVRLDSRETLDQPPFGFVIDYMTYGGIYRDVYLEVHESVYIKSLFVRTGSLTPQSTCAELRLTAELSCLPPTPQDIHIAIAAAQDENAEPLHRWQLKTGDSCIIETAYQLPLLSEAELQAGEARAGALTPWTPQHPQLYTVTARIGDNNEETRVRTGLRAVEFKADGFYLNGTKIKLRGLNRHQSYPYVGYAMPAAMQRRDADILYYELGCNAVRTSHYPQSHDFIDRCDELGLLVFTEIPGWQHIGGERWQQLAVDNTREMVEQYRNHPSIFLWGVRINESQDADELYRKTNAAAHAADDSRPTGGVRAIKKSHLLEDVYTYNDFVHDGKAHGCEPKHAVTSDMAKGYLISEYNGHMYPTKAYDCEEHRLEHARRHAAVLDEVATQEDIAGSFGWCMFDYNTHRDFGSGDRICYHGVTDMFRNPKLAAAVYAAQSERADVLELSSSMDIGEHPATNRGDTMLITNADSVRMYRNDELICEFDTHSTPYPHLAHPPLLLEDYIGSQLETKEHYPPAQARHIKSILNHVAKYGMAQLPPHILLHAAWLMLRYRMKVQDVVNLYTKYVGDWGGSATVYRFEAVKDGRVVKTLTKAPMTQVYIEAEADHTRLRELHSYDVAAVRIRAVDEHGNLLPYFSAPVTLEIAGSAELIGPEVISLQGGQGGTYIKTTGTAGEATLTIRTQQTPELTLHFTIETIE